MNTVLFSYSDGLIESAVLIGFIPYGSRNCIAHGVNTFDIVENNSIRDSMKKESSLVTQRYEQMKYESVSVLRELISIYLKSCDGRLLPKDQLQVHQIG